MTTPAPVHHRLLDAIAPFIALQSGTTGTPTALQGLRIWSSTTVTTPTPDVFRPMFYTVLRGSKLLEIGGQSFALHAGGCASSSFGLPYIGQIAKASPAAPYVALGFDIDIRHLTSVMLDMPSVEDRWVCSAAEGTLEGPIGESFLRLVGLLAHPADQAMLRRHYETELYYRLLQSPMGDTLRQLGQRNGRLRQIKAATDWLTANPDKPVVIPTLADSVGMSLTSFHRHFRAVTGYSPLAFQRHMRLLEAQRLLAGGDVTVSRVAYAVGYVSPSQFSREYKTMFGKPPVADRPARRQPA